MSAPPSPHSKALESLNKRLLEAGVTEGQLITWLKDVEAVPPGIFALRSIPARRLEILLEKWADALEQLLDARARDQRIEL
jgi:hypothetical protein